MRLIIPRVACNSVSRPVFPRLRLFHCTPDTLDLPLYRVNAELHVLATCTQLVLNSTFSVAKRVECFEDIVSRRAKGAWYNMSVL